MSKILIIEDSEVIRDELVTFLSKYNYNVTAPNVFDNILEEVKKQNPDLILLDINLPIFDGYYICREIRKTSSVPIIIVTSRDSEMDELMSMNLGADDFVTKPYNTQILLARISNILKRTNISTSIDTISYGEIKLNIANGTVALGNQSVELTKNELKIFTHLIKNKGKIVSREALMEYLWTSECFVDDNTLSVNVTRLRKKLEDVGGKDVIETRRGLGYILA